MTKQKILKIKVGEVFINGKSHSVYKTAWKSGKCYELTEKIFINEVEIKPKEEEKKELEP